jgi:hypothetical protein
MTFHGQVSFSSFVAVVEFNNFDCVK